MMQLANLQKRLLATLMALAVGLCILPGTAEAYDQYGGKMGAVRYDYYEGTLTISGNGAMPDFSALTDIPWWTSAVNGNAIERIVVEEGVTHIGDHAFEGAAATSVSLPSTLTSIGYSAFASCRNLESIDIPASVQTLGEEAFLGCASLKSVVIPDGVTTIPAYGFEGCTSLAHVTIPTSVKKIDGHAFYACPLLAGPENVTYAGSDDEWDEINIITPQNDWLVNRTCKHNNTHVEGKVSATCQREGFTGKTVCDDCGATVDEGKSTGLANHRFTRSKLVRETCTEDGYWCRVCAWCGIEDEHEVLPAAHSWDEKVPGRPATAEADGYTGYDICSRCGAKSGESQVLHWPSDTPIRKNEVAATCTTDGEYDRVITCVNCGEILSSKHVIVLELGHESGRLVKENERAATCTAEGGYDMVSRCTVCNELLSTEHVATPKADHTPAEPVRENEKAATYTEAGSYDAVVYCSVCDQELSRETKVIDKLPTVSYEIIKGATQTVTKGSEATFTSNAEFWRFVEVRVDGKAISADNYTVVSGSTKVTLTARYTNTLGNGEHTLDIVSDNGMASTTFTVRSATSKTAIPQTGDLVNDQQLLGVMMGSALAVTALLALRKKADSR